MKKIDRLIETRQIIDEAREAGRKAAKEKLEELSSNGPKYEVFSADLAGNKVPGSKTYPLLDLCGFAQIHIMNRRDSFWRNINKMHNLKERVYVAIGPYGGWIDIFDMTNRQEVSVNHAAAQAASEILQKYNIDCYVTTKLD